MLSYDKESHYMHIKGPISLQEIRSSRLNMAITEVLPYEGYKEDPKLYEMYHGKLQAYRDALKFGILDEYRLPDELVPETDGIDVTGIPKKFLTKSEFEITESSGTELVKKIAEGTLTSVEVFKAFAKRCTAAHQLTNCAMQLFVNEGLERARELDEYYVKTGHTIGSLHGLPVSLKEKCGYKGKITHGSYVAGLDYVSEEWPNTVKALSDAGAVFYVRTTEPQCMWSICSFNNITGLAKNPNNTSLSTAGSSSGEGAITAMKGSVFGLGSDTGGSIRCPAAFNGVWGLRSTQKRISTIGGRAVAPDTGKPQLQECVCGVYGPLARSADDINLFMSSIIDQKPWERDATLIPLPWRRLKLPSLSSLTVAVIYDDGLVKPTTPIQRGLKYSVKALEAAGAKIVSWEPIDVKMLLDVCCCSINGDGCKSQLASLAKSGEPISKLTKWSLSYGCGVEGVTTTKYQQQAAVRDEYRNIYQDRMTEKGIDFILTPTYCSVAGKQQKVLYGGYTAIWNLLDMPGIVFPTGLRCDPELDAPEEDFNPRSEIEAYEHKIYDSAENYKGAPINLQFIGRRWFDEELVQAAHVVQEAIINYN